MEEKYAQLGKKGRARYMDNVKALYGSQPLAEKAPVVAAQPRHASKKESDYVPTESDDQILLAVWLKKKGIRFTASANGGKRNYYEAIKLKRMGVSPGFPDIEIPYPSGKYHGLYIELKRKKGGKVSPEQAEWLQYLRDKGYYAEIAHGFEEAKEIVTHYLSLTPYAA